MRSVMEVLSLMLILKYSKNKFANWEYELILYFVILLYQSISLPVSIIGKICSINASSLAIK